MDTEITNKRRLVLILVVVSVAIFIGLVWLIANYLPWSPLSGHSPTDTDAPRRPEINCTYPVSYWKEHPELYPPQIVIGSETYQSKDLRGILSKETLDITSQLQLQLIVVFLNILSGADQNPIEATIFDAYGWLEQHPEGSEVAESDRETGNQLFTLLDAYNRGLAWVVPCVSTAILAPTFTSTATNTATVFLTLTPTMTLTPSPSATPSITATSLPPTPIPTIFIPSETPTPTRTERPIPTATDTRVPPIEEPTQTNTPSPSDTPEPPPTITEAPTETEGPTPAPLLK